MSARIKIFFIVVFLLLVSCEENFSPKEDFTKEYILNCIIRGNSNFQTAAILRSFNVAGYAPEKDSTNQFIEGAEITLQYNDTTYKFIDTTMTSLVDQRFNDPLKLYYIDNFKADILNRNMTLRATLPNGKVLTSSTELPIAFNFDFNRQNATNYIPPRSPKLNSINIFWITNDASYYQYYLAKLKIYFHYVQNGNQIEKFIEVPVSSKMVEGVEYLNYPKPSRSFSISYPLEMVDRAMEKILEDENFSEAGKISVKRWATIEVLALNDKLAAYYYAGLSENPYTTRIDDVNYSNIEGGYGIFGSLWIEDYRLRITDDYIGTFGYKVGD